MTETDEDRPVIAHAIALLCEWGEQDGIDVRVTDDIGDIGDDGRPERPRLAEP